MTDLARAEPIQQLDIEELPTEFPALTSLDLVPHKEAAQPTSLSGRDREVAELAGLLAEHRLTASRFRRGAASPLMPRQGGLASNRRSPASSNIAKNGEQSPAFDLSGLRYAPVI